jgi:hypothetical protein
LVLQTGDAEQRQLDELKQLRELAFVITDLEASTAIAAGAPRQFEKARSFSPCHVDEASCMRLAQA